MCNLITKIESEKSESYIPINKAIVNGTVGIGIGYTQLCEFSAILEIPYLSTNTYGKIFDELSTVIEQTAWEQMRLAGIEEKNILRNYSTKLSALTKNTKYPTYLRQLITKNITKFCVAIRKAIQYRKNLNINNIAKIKGN